MNGNVATGTLKRGRNDSVAVETFDLESFSRPMEPLSFQFQAKLDNLFCSACCSNSKNGKHTKTCFSFFQARKVQLVQFVVKEGPELTKAKRNEEHKRTHKRCIHLQE